MYYAIIALILFVFVVLLSSKKNATKTDAQEKAAEEKNLDISGAYQQRWLFTMHEKDAYRKLKEIADGSGYTVFAKVRLLDLLEPKKGIQKYKTYFYKVQAKHVDFVLCDEKLVARCIVELDDSSHDAQQRKDRDGFVDAVLESVGYKIIHTREITEEIKQQICNT